jgi:hypothetical protein
VVREGVRRTVDERLVAAGPEAGPNPERAALPGDFARHGLTAVRNRPAVRAPAQTGSRNLQTALGEVEPVYRGSRVADVSSWMVGYSSITFFDLSALPRRKTNGRMRRNVNGVQRQWCAKAKALYFQLHSVSRLLGSREARNQVSLPASLSLDTVDICTGVREEIN